MRILILVRHATSQVTPGVPPHQWGLTAEGIALCLPLAEKLSIHKPKLIVTSVETKARETGESIAHSLNIPCHTGQDLHEHQRQGSKITSLKQFHAHISDLFAHPDRLVFGLETAQGALERFTRAVKSVMENNSQDCIAVVSHGTVMALYYGKLTGEDPFSFWQQLGMPAFYVVSWPGGEVLELKMDI